ncbi:Hypothetical protein I595_1249 [Croceitalea dokdonensis DOKDO 023]|uniref:Uncharacterized protein n=1 Tax=Croceitalea dokdonensis DOKDO 023 TaxID=1300341 RepID=A0A0P7AVZ4_9FLAO|nr:hypothetical protein [Croceitalea dokdonensis]KPM32822.1 Hypothetical protein I595_1249 [Croceitalea dokdonensis DOKDO 023]
MRYIFTLLFFVILNTQAQEQTVNYVKKIDHFPESRGDAENGLILSLPKQEMVQLEQQLNSKSGLGPMFNYYGTVVVVDQMDTLPNGNRLLVLRREDGKKFYGYKDTIKAILLSNQNKELSLTLNQQ